MLDGVVTGPGNAPVPAMEHEAEDHALLVGRCRGTGGEG